MKTSFSIVFFILLFLGSLQAQEIQVDGIYYNFIDDKTVEVANSPYEDREGSIEELSVVYLDPYTGDVVIPGEIIYEGKICTVGKIKKGAFSGCPDLNSVTVPASIEVIENAFQEASNLTAIFVSENNPIYSSGEGVLFNKDYTDLLCFPRGKKGNYTIPNSISAIRPYHFYRCSGLESVFIPDNVASIGEGAFSECTHLSSVRLSARISIIENATFYTCSSLQNIELPDNIKRINTYAFAESGLRNITIPSNAEFVYSEAFIKCPDLESIEIAGENTLWYHDLSGEGYPVISENGVLYTRDKKSFVYCPAGKTGNVPVAYGVETVAYQAFLQCKKLSSVHIPASVTELQFGCFESSRITDLHVPWEDPLLLEYNPFYGMKQAECILHVPDGAAKKYRQTDYWSLFDIQETTTLLSINSFDLQIYNDCIVFSNLSCPAYFTLADLHGRIVRKENITVGKTINIADLPIGVYIMKVTTADGKTVTRKVLYP
jgi:hypothetical protein